MVSETERRNDEGEREGEREREPSAASSRHAGDISVMLGSIKTSRL
jgi:hypothetical protein